MENKLLVEIGKRLLERRKQLRMTQDELAEKAGVTSQMISTAELGKKAMRPENIIKICSVLEISTDYLLMGNIGPEDYSYLSDKVAALPPGQYRHLENIINSFIMAVEEEKKEGSCTG